MSRKQIRSARLRAVFPADAKRQFSAKLARLCVLYEDLRVEVCGIAEPSIPSLDALDSEQENQFSPERIGRYRRYYFVRRSIATIREFAQALRMIDSDPDFHLDATVDPRAEWDSAIKFFDENEQRLNAIRNDIGGHFGHPAALNAIDKLRSDVFGAIELVDRRELRLQFAGEIAGSALLPHLQNDDIKEYEALLRDCIKPAYKHATRSVHTLVAKYLWRHFGR